MSWHSDGEPFPRRERDPEWCERCTREDVTKQICDRCTRRHLEAEKERGREDE